MTIDCSKLEPGTICVTRDCGDAEYIGNFVTPEGLCYAFHNEKARLFSVFSSGKRGPNPSSLESSLDIIAIKKPKRVLDCWVNVYEGGKICEQDLVSLTKEKSHIRWYDHKIIACLHIVQEYEEGEGIS